MRFHYSISNTMLKTSSPGLSKPRPNSHEEVEGARPFAHGIVSCVTPEKKEHSSFLMRQNYRYQLLAPPQTHSNGAFGRSKVHEQLYRQIRDELTSGSFTNRETRLPSSRALAVDLGISRLTVNLALSKLHAEGYLHSGCGAMSRVGTFFSSMKKMRP